MVLMLIIESQKINTNNKASVKSVFKTFVNKSFKKSFDPTFLKNINKKTLKKINYFFLFP